jgi:F-type H+-transporting ATPase subunit delta
VPHQSSEAIAERYARALLDLAIEDGNIDQYAQDIARFDELLDASTEARLVLTNPAIPMALRQAVVSKLVETLKLSRVASNFLRLLVERGRIRVLKHIVRAFLHGSDSRSHRVRGRVISPLPLTPPQLDRLSQAIGKLLNRQAILSPEVDPDLIGGVRIEIAGQTFDGSLRNHLDRIRERVQLP